MGDLLQRLCQSLGFPLAAQEEDDEVSSSTPEVDQVLPQDIPLPPDSDDDLLVIDEGQSELEDL